MKRGNRRPLVGRNSYRASTAPLPDTPSSQPQQPPSQQHQTLTQRTGVSSALAAAGTSALSIFSPYTVQGVLSSTTPSTQQSLPKPIEAEPVTDADTLSTVTVPAPPFNGGSELGHENEPTSVFESEGLGPARTLKLRVNGALNALSASPDKDQVVVAGREVLKILSVTDRAVTEVLNLRVGVKLNLNFSSNDVKWSPYARNTIATAATNGAVAIWDLNRPGVQKLDRILTEHARAVNRITFHPSEEVLMLSASQDGTMKLWDLRQRNSPARHTFEGKAESVRDVRFSPTNAFEFAAAFENGNLQKWDIRNPSQLERKWSAHNGLALTVDWHPDGRLIASGGRDRQIKVWDTKSEQRKPLYTFQTIAPVARVAWRPGYETQLSSCSLTTDARIQTWDLGSPYIPMYALEAHENVATGFLWHNSNTVWSVSKDRMFISHDIRSAYKPMDLLNTNAHAWNCFGDMTFAIDERRRVEEET
ncbi:WD repeat-containing protein 24, partial [Rhizophlyctis rosea]